MSMDTRIRCVVPGDAEGVWSIYAPHVRSSAVTFETAEPSIEEMARRISSISMKYPWLIYGAAGEVFGYAYACRHRERAAYQWSIEVSVYIDEAHRGQGIGSALYDALFGIVAAQGFVTAYAGITLPNPASVALHEKKGFTPIGVFKDAGFKLNAWHDVGWWQLSLRKKNLAPDVPVEFPTWVRQSGGQILSDLGVMYPKPEE